MRWLCLVLGLSLWTGAAWALDPATTGVVLLHGKWGDPSQMRSMGEALEAEGFTVTRPAMPWAGYRDYDKTYDGAMDEVAQAVAELRARGMRQVVVGGQSLGGNGALHYGTLDGGLAALVLVAPAHAPEHMGQVADSVAQARAMVSAGEKGDRGSFLDINSGGRSRIQHIPADIYLSYYAPEGPASMSLAAPKLLVQDVFWAAMSEDPSSKIFAEQVVPRLPAATRLERVDLTGGHLDGPAASTAAIVQWLKALPAP